MLITFVCICHRGCFQSAQHFYTFFLYVHKYCFNIKMWLFVLCMPQQQRVKSNNTYLAYTDSLSIIVSCSHNSRASCFQTYIVIFVGFVRIVFAVYICHSQFFFVHTLLRLHVVSHSLFISLSVGPSHFSVCLSTCANQARRTNINCYFYFCVCTFC